MLGVCLLDIKSRWTLFFDARKALELGQHDNENQQQPEPVAGAPSACASSLSLFIVLHQHHCRSHCQRYHVSYGHRQCQAGLLFLLAMK